MTVPVLLYYATIEEMWEDFKEKPDTRAEILFASYVPGSYDGSAYVLFRKDGQLFDVEANHCSCSGIDGQWSPGKTSLEAIRLRTKPDKFGFTTSFMRDFGDDIEPVLTALESEVAR